MRIDIKTQRKRIRDNDVRCLTILMFALTVSTPRMIRANLEYVADIYGYDIVPKRGA